jgi:hypothetical protein
MVCVACNLLFVVGPNTTTTIPSQKTLQQQSLVGVMDHPAVVATDHHQYIPQQSSSGIIRPMMMMLGGGGVVGGNDGSSDTAQQKPRSTRLGTGSNAHPVIVLPGVSERIVWQKLQAALEQRGASTTAVAHPQAVSMDAPEVNKHRILSEGEYGSSSSGGGTILEAIRAYNNNQGAATASATRSCHIPLATSKACRAETYTVLAVVAASVDDTNSSSTENSWQRTLFVNCLKWMVDPSATSVHVLLPVTAEGLLQRNVAYGRRLLVWHTQVDHPVKLIFGNSLWDALDKFQKYQSTIATTNKSYKQRLLRTGEEEGTTPAPAAGNAAVSDSILWVSGDEVWRGNRNGIQQGFRLWKGQSASLVSASAWQFQYQTNDTSLNADTNAESKSSAQQSRRLAIALPEMIRIDGAAARNMGHDDTKQQQQLVPVMADLTTATFHHRFYLCFLQHPVLSRLREGTVDDWEAARFGVSTWLSLVAPSDAELRGTSKRSNLRREKFVPSSPSTDDKSKSTASGSSAKDVRFFAIFSVRNASDHTDLTVDEEEEVEDANDPLPSLVPLDARKLAVLSMFGGPPLLPDKSVDAGLTATSWKDYESC